MVGCGCECAVPFGGFPPAPGELFDYFVNTPQSFGLTLTSGSIPHVLPGTLWTTSPTHGSSELILVDVVAACTIFGGGFARLRVQVNGVPHAFCSIGGRAFNTIRKNIVIRFSWRPSNNNPITIQLAAQNTTTSFLLEPTGQCIFYRRIFAPLSIGTDTATPIGP